MCNEYQASIHSFIHPFKPPTIHSSSFYGFWFDSFQDKTSGQNFRSLFFELTIKIYTFTLFYGRVLKRRQRLTTATFFALLQMLHRKTDWIFKWIFKCVINFRFHQNKPFHFVPLSSTSRPILFNGNKKIWFTLRLLSGRKMFRYMMMMMMMIPMYK